MNKTFKKLLDAVCSQRFVETSSMFINITAYLEVPKFFNLESHFSKQILVHLLSLVKKQKKIFIENWIIKSQEIMFFKKKVNVFVRFKQFLDSSQLQTPFKDSMPGKEWYKSFLTRHPNITDCFPEGLSSARSYISEQNIRK